MSRLVFDTSYLQCVILSFVLSSKPLRLTRFVNSLQYCALSCLRSHSHSSFWRANQIEYNSRHVTSNSFSFHCQTLWQCRGCANYIFKLLLPDNIMCHESLKSIWDEMKLKKTKRQLTFHIHKYSKYVSFSGLAWLSGQRARSQREA